LLRCVFRSAMQCRFSPETKPRPRGRSDSLRDDTSKPVRSVRANKASGAAVAPKV
jgi:hypothetical protein